MLRHKDQIFRWFFLIALFFAGVEECPSQEGSNHAFRQIIIDQAGLGKTELVTFDKGGMVTKLLPAKEKREIAVFGVISIRASIEEVETAFQKTITAKRKKTALGFSRFGRPPDVRDVEKLTLEQKEIENLKTCRIGKCGLKLSAPMIDRLRTEVDWDADGYQEQAIRLYRRMLVEYLISYLDKGNEALIKYQNKKKTVDVSGEQRSLLSNLFWLTETAPELADYLRRYPDERQPKVVDTFSWSKIKFGLKPVIILIHTSTYETKAEDLVQKVIVSKQIYSSRYIDSSLGLTAMVDGSGGNGSALTYLIFANHTRASALGSKLGGLVRGLVENQALDELETVLKGTKQNVAIALANREQVSVLTKEEGIAEWVAARKFGILLTLFLLSITILILYYRSSR